MQTKISEEKTVAITVKSLHFSTHTSSKYSWFIVFPVIVYCSCNDFLEASPINGSKCNRKVIGKNERVGQHSIVFLNEL